MINIYGSVGYTLLENTNINPNYILLFSDIHSNLDHCTNYVQISDWLKKNMDNQNIHKV